MAAIFYHPRTLKSPPASHRTGSRAWSTHHRRSRTPVFARVRRVLATIGQALLFLWVVVALAAWTLILVSLFD
jgi:hypothetical protein